MNAREITDLLHRDPFQPFRLRLTSGDSHEVRNPVLAVPMRSRLFVAAPDSDDWKLVPYLHIAAVETGSNGKSARRKRR